MPTQRRKNFCRRLPTLRKNFTGACPSLALGRQSFCRVTKKRGLPRFVSAKYSLVRLQIYYTIRKYAIASFTELFFRNFQKNSILINFSLCKRLFCLARRALYIFFFLFFFFIFVFFFLFIFYFLEEKEKGGVGEKEKTFFRT